MFIVLSKIFFSRIAIKMTPHLHDTSSLRTVDRPVWHGGHVDPQENKKLCFCTASFALNSHLAEADARDSTWPPSDKGLFESYLQSLINLCKDDMN